MYDINLIVDGLNIIPANYKFSDYHILHFFSSLYFFLLYAMLWCKVCYNFYGGYCKQVSQPNEDFPCILDKKFKSKCDFVLEAVS